MAKRPLGQGPRGPPPRVKRRGKKETDRHMRAPVGRVDSTNYRGGYFRFDFLDPPPCFSRIAACAAASRAMGTRNGEQLT